MGGTYGANAVSCAAALAVLDAFRDEKILDNVGRSQDIMMGHFKTIQSKVPSGFIREVRGRGLMFGVELNKLPGGNFGAAASAVLYSCQKKDLLLLSCGPYDTIRLIPPLNVSPEELNRGMSIFTDSLAEVAHAVGKNV
jgi:4-aminobutyrate aminotransferase